jgi:hypothetical protein
MARRRKCTEHSPISQAMGVAAILVGVAAPTVVVVVAQAG